MQKQFKRKKSLREDNSVDNESTLTRCFFYDNSCYSGEINTKTEDRGRKDIILGNRRNRGSGKKKHTNEQKEKYVQWQA